MGVILGGLSSEREVSLKSGHAIIEALQKEGLIVKEIDLNTEKPKEVEHLIKGSGIDIAFIAMHGRFGEDGKLQHILESINMVYIGSDSLASALAMDKISSKRIFKEKNIPTPKYKILNKFDRDVSNFKSLGMPLVIKPKSQGSSIGVSFVNDINDLEDAFKTAFSYDDSVIVEECIDGVELTVGILDDHALEPIQIVSKSSFFDFKAKYTKGMTDYVLPADINERTRMLTQSLALKAHKALGCRHFSRVDLMVDRDNNPYVLEVNTIPGFTSTSLLPKAALYEGITFSQLCIRLINLALRDTVIHKDYLLSSKQ